MTNSLSWSLNSKAILKKAQQRLYFLRRLKRFGLSTKALVNFYRCNIESVLTGCITVWFRNATVQDIKQLQGIVKRAAKIIGSELPQLHTIYNTRCKKKTKNILKDSSHPAYSLFHLLPSTRRYQSIKSHTNRFSNSFYAQAIRLLNEKLKARRG